MPRPKTTYTANGGMQIKASHKKGSDQGGIRLEKLIPLLAKPLPPPPARASAKGIQPSKPESQKTAKVDSSLTTRQPPWLDNRCPRAKNLPKSSQMREAARAKPQDTSDDDDTRSCASDDTSTPDAMLSTTDSHDARANRSVRTEASVSPITIDEMSPPTSPTSNEATQSAPTPQAKKELGQRYRGDLIIDAFPVVVKHDGELPERCYRYDPYQIDSSTCDLIGQPINAKQHLIDHVKRTVQLFSGGEARSVSVAEAVVRASVIAPSLVKHILGKKKDWKSFMVNECGLHYFFHDESQCVDTVYMRHHDARVAAVPPEIAAVNDLAHDKILRQKLAVLLVKSAERFRADPRFAVGGTERYGFRVKVCKDRLHTLLSEDPFWSHETLQIPRKLITCHLYKIVKLGVDTRASKSIVRIADEPLLDHLATSAGAWETIYQFIANYNDMNAYEDAKVTFEVLNGPAEEVQEDPLERFAPKRRSSSPPPPAPVPQALRIATQPVVLTQKGHIKLDSKKRNKMLQRRERQKEKKINDVESEEDSSVPRRQAQKDKRQAAAAALAEARRIGANVPGEALQTPRNRPAAEPETPSTAKASPATSMCSGEAGVSDSEGSSTERRTGRTRRGMRARKSFQQPQQQQALDGNACPLMA